MRNTWLKLTDTRCQKLIDALESTPMSKRDSTYNQLIAEIKQIRDVWKHINIKTIHRSKVKDTVKTNSRRV